ncbi:MAG: hypothetical protein WA610_15240 [Thermodesulfovibrionales bacterium]
MAIDSIQINLELGKLPDTRKMERLFDSEMAWALYLHKDEYYLEYKPPAFNEPFWVVRFDRNFETTTLYYGEKLIRTEEGIPSASNPLCYPLDQLLLMHLMARRNGILIHAAGMGLSGKGLLFPGRSGAGKSTLSRLFLGHRHIEMLSDDRIALRKINDTFRIFGTPWAGDAGIAENKNFPFSGMFFIRHGSDNTLRELNPEETLKRLMPVISVPWYDKSVISGMLTFCEELISNVPAYELYFRPEKEVVPFLENFLSTKEAP